MFRRHQNQFSGPNLGPIRATIPDHFLGGRGPRPPALSWVVLAPQMPLSIFGYQQWAAGIQNHHKLTRRVSVLRMRQHQFCRPILRPVLGNITFKHVLQHSQRRHLWLERGESACLRVWPSKIIIVPDAARPYPGRPGPAQPDPPFPRCQTWW